MFVSLIGISHEVSQVQGCRAGEFLNHPVNQSPIHAGPVGRILSWSCFTRTPILLFVARGKTAKTKMRAVRFVIHRPHETFIPDSVDLINFQQPNCSAAHILISSQRFSFSPRQKTVRTKTSIHTYAALRLTNTLRYSVSSYNSRYAIVRSFRAKATIAVFRPRHLATLLYQRRSRAVSRLRSIATKCAI